MDLYNLKIKEYLHLENRILTYLYLDQACHPIGKAAEIINVPVNKFVKNICLIDGTGTLIVAIVTGEDRVSTKRVGRALNIERPRLAGESEVLQNTGYPSGGVPSFGYNAIFLIDPKVMTLDFVYTGGGSPFSLIKIETNDLLRINQGQVIRVRK